jgi:hypothetical protein
MTPIKIIDSTTKNLSQGGQHVELEYAAQDAEPSVFLGQIPGLGVLRGLIVPSVARLSCMERDGGRNNNKPNIALHRTRGRR